MARSFGGGFRFRRYAGRPGSETIELPVPPRITVLLQQGFAAANRPLVEVGRAVAAGEVIGRNDEDIATPVHASLGGTVVGIREVETGTGRVPAVDIETSPGRGWIPLGGHRADWQALAPDEIESLLYRGGVTALSPAGIPTRFRSSVVAPADVRDVIVHHVNAEPLGPSWSALLAGRRAGEFAAGLRILARVFEGARLHLAFDAGDAGLRTRLEQLFPRPGPVGLCPVQARYPQAADAMLMMVVLGREFPFGFPAASAGVVTLDFQAVLHAHDAVTRGKPVIERLVALAGPGFTRPVHALVRVGTPVAEVVAGRLDPRPARLVLDSALNGIDVPDAGFPVSRTTAAVLALREAAERVPFLFVRPGRRRDSWTRAFLAWYLPAGRTADTNQHGEERPCVQCGYCSRVCPVRIMPHLIVRSKRQGLSELQQRYGVFNCIDCNLCTFVCPSKIQLAAQLREIKERLVADGCDNSSCVVPKFDLRGIERYRGVRSVR